MITAARRKITTAEAKPLGSKSVVCRGLYTGNLFF
jgi:hypothetical protein